jgi:hypothetical protein
LQLFQTQYFQAQLWAAGFLRSLGFSHMGISAAFSACFIRPIFANIRLRKYSRERQRLAPYSPKGTPAIAVAGRDQRPASRRADLHKWLAIRKLAVAYAF